MEEDFQFIGPYRRPRYRIEITNSFSNQQQCSPSWGEIEEDQYEDHPFAPPYISLINEMNTIYDGIEEKRILIDHEFDKLLEEFKVIIGRLINHVEVPVQESKERMIIDYLNVLLDSFTIRNGGGFDPIAYMNLGSEIKCILKKDLEKFCPDSQLAVRFSGQWKEQISDLDEEGNSYFLNVPQREMSVLLSHLQLQALSGLNQPMRIIESAELKMKALLDYLSIDNIALEIE